MPRSRNKGGFGLGHKFPSLLVTLLFVITCDGAVRRKRDDSEQVCYGPELGCYDNKPPFDNIEVLPAPPEDVGTKFHLYTRQLLQAPKIFHFNDRKNMTEEDSGYKSTSNTKFIVHGFTSGCNRQWVQEMKNALLSQFDLNVICVDWSLGAARPDYLQAAANIRLVAKQLALLISDLRNVSGEHNFHIIGFSLGAHLAGAAGQIAGNITRISGLDPAGPLFESYDPAVRLDKTDALFVDVIHTSGDSLMDGGVGSMVPMGHVDFFPNGGKDQAGCPKRFFFNFFRDVFRRRSSIDPAQVVQSGTVADPYGNSLCSHKRVYKLYTESILPTCQFTGYKCDNFHMFMNGDLQCLSGGTTRPMGYYADKTPVTNSDSDEKYFLVTRGDYPYCANQLLLELKIHPEQNATIGGVELMFSNAHQRLRSQPDRSIQSLKLTKSPQETLEGGQSIRQVIATSPSSSSIPTDLTLKYKAYKGWFAKGTGSLAVEALSIRPFDGESMDACKAFSLLSGQYFHLTEATASSRGQCYAEIS